MDISAAAGRHSGQSMRDGEAAGAIMRRLARTRPGMVSSIRARIRAFLYLRKQVVPKKQVGAGAENGRPKRRKLTAVESLQRMKEFDKRKESFIAALRKSKDRGLSS